MTAVLSEDRRLRVSLPQTDQITMAETYSYVLKQNTAHSDTQSAHFDKNTHVIKYHKQPYISFKDIKSAAIKKMVDKHAGITYLDVLKLADNPAYTPKQAKYLLRHHKKKGKLFTS